MQRRIGRRRARVRDTSIARRISASCGSWCAIEKRRTVTLATDKPSSITRTNQHNRVSVRNVHKISTFLIILFARETQIFFTLFSINVSCPQLTTISCERRRLCFPKAGVCVCPSHVQTCAPVKSPSWSRSEILKIHPIAVRKAYICN